MKPVARRRPGAGAIVALAIGVILSRGAAGQSLEDRYGIVIGPAPAPPAASAPPERASSGVAMAGASADSQVLLSYDRNNPPAMSEGNPLRTAPAPPAIQEPVPPTPPASSSSLSAAAPLDLAEIPLAAGPSAIEQPASATFAPGSVELAAHAVEVPAAAVPAVETDAGTAAAEPLAVAPAEPPTENPSPESALPSGSPFTANSFDLSSGPDEADAKSRRLSPPSSGAALRESSGVASRAASMLPAALGNLESLSTAGIGLAAVVGLLVLCTWGFRRGGPKRGGSLPDEAFAVLGRAPLAAQSFAQLLRVGNKLVLVAITPQGAQALAEVTDPMEVGRLIGLCGNGTGHGPSAEFQQVLAQLAREPARGFLEKETHGGRRA
jgi:flagellar biogenesis protein FliO